MEKIILTLVCMLIALIARSQWTNVIHGDTLYLKNLGTKDSFRYVMPSQLNKNLLDSIGFGTKADAPLTVSNVLCPECPKPPLGTVLHAIQQSNTANARITMDDFSNTTRGANFMGRKTRGSTTSPTPPVSNDVLAAFTGDGWGVDSFTNRAVVGVVLRADSGTWNNNSKPTKIVLSTTPEGSNTQVDAMTVDRNGKLWLPKLTNGFIRTDVNGGTYASPITSADVTGALGYTPSSGTVTSVGAGYGMNGGTITTTGVHSVDTSSANGVVSKDRLANVVSTPTYNNAPSVTLNSSSQLSTTKRTRVSYTVSVASLVSVGQAIAYLEISSNNSTWVTINSAGETSVGLLNTKYYNIQGEVPAGWYRRIRTAVTLGGQVTFISGQEVQY